MLSVLLISFSLFGCNSQQELPFSKVVNSSTASRSTITPQDIGVMYVGQGVAYGVQEAEGGKFWRTYQVPASSSFHGISWLRNQQPSEDFLLTCLVDYRQVPCVFDGEEGLLYRISMGDSEERSIPFETPPLPQGFHDLAILAIAKPGVHDLSRRYRFSTDFNYLFPQRVVLLAGDKPWQVPSIEYTTTGEQPSSQATRFDGLVVNQEEHRQKLKAWLTQKAKPGEVVEYYVHMGNDVGPSETHAVMAFLDYKQIPLDGRDQWVSYVSLPAGTRATMSGRFTAPQKLGVHEFMIVWAYNPYHMLEDPSQGQNRQLTQASDVVESSIRVAIVVEE